MLFINDHPDTRGAFYNASIRFTIMGRKSQGTSLERRMVKNAFKAGGWGFRFPGSGTFTVDKNGKRTEHQSRCTIDLGKDVTDVVYKLEYITTDYIAYYPEWKEVRVVEVKSVRTNVDPRSTAMVEYYYLTDKRDGGLVKSNFCIELERTWLLAEMMEPAFTVPVTPYFQVRFINSDRELFIKIPDLLRGRKTEHDVLKVSKNADGEIIREWQERTSKREKD